MFKHTGMLLLFLAGISLAMSGCGSSRSHMNMPEKAIKIDGSSTVYPIMEAAAEEFRKQYPRVRVTVGISGTGGGFKKFAAGETDIATASRRIKPSEEQTARSNGIDFIEMPVACDGITVAINPANDFAGELSVAELKRIWEPSSKVTTWKDVRGEWPDKPLHLYGAGTDSGTFEYFTAAVVGEQRASRSDYTASEDDNMLVKGIAGDRDALGYLGYGYYLSNSPILKPVAVKQSAGGKPVLPNKQTISTGEYAPLSRPVFVYASSLSVKRPEVKEFLDFLIEKAPELVEQAGYVALQPSDYATAAKALRDFHSRRVASASGTR